MPRRRFQRVAPALVLLILLFLLPSPAMAAEEEPGKLRCTIKGTEGGDELRGTPGDDVICAKQGDDTITALGGDDYVFGAGGDDRIDGGGGRDHLLGELAHDHIVGGPGSDWLYGEEGNDRLHGEGGDDALYGHLGGDRHVGGPGLDHISGGPGKDLGEPKRAAAGGLCPTTGPYCEFSLHLDVKSYCPSYSKGMSIPACVGATPYGPPAWAVYIMDLPGMFAGFNWFDGCCYRAGWYYKLTEYGTAVLAVPSSRLIGKVPYAASAEYSIDEAWSLLWPNPGIRFHTPEWPGAGPGKLGGPLYLNFVNGIVGADMYIDGYLFPM
jgi:hypothetical protein